MALVKLFILLGIMLVMLMVLRRPLWMGTAVAAVAAVLLYAIPPLTALELTWQALIDTSTLEVLAVIYLVNLLQVMMQRKGAIVRAERAMVRLFNNRRSIIMLAPIFMGLLPAPNAIVLSAPIVDATASGDLSTGDKTFLTSYLRHVPEASLPFFPSLILALKVTGLSAGMFLLGVLPLAALSVLFCYFTVVRKVPRETGLPASENRGRDALELFFALWPIIILIVAVLLGGFNTALSTLVACGVLFFAYRFPLKDVWPLLKKAFSPTLVGSMALIMVLKGLVASTGIIDALPALFSGLPIPLYLTYAFITFIGGMTGLVNAVIILLFPIAFATVPHGGIPLLVLLMSYSHSAGQVSPTHICLEVAVDYFKSDYRTLIGKTLPVTLFYCVTAVLYYLLLTAVF